MKTATYKGCLKYSGILALSVLLLGSCIDEGQMKKGAAIRFNVYTEGADAPATRSAAGIIACTVDSASDTVFLIESEEAASDDTGIRTRAEVTTAITQKFSTIGYRATTEAGLNGIAPWFHNAETNPNGTLVTPMYWIDAIPHAQFFAVYPQVTASYTKLSLSPDSYADTPYVDFEVEPNVTDQKDLMTACSGAVHYAPSGEHPQTDLTFRHALTAVRFKVGPNLSWSRKITKIEIVDAQSKGRYTLSTKKNGKDAAWSNLSDPETITLGGINVPLDTVTAAVDSLIIGRPGKNHTFYMIPQSLTGVSVKIYFDNNPTPAITADLTGFWKPGTVKTYSLSQTTSDWQYVLNVTSPDTVAYNATSAGDYTIQSYRWDTATGTQQPVAWKIVGYQESTDGGMNFGPETTTKPEWLIALSLEQGGGGTTAQAGTATLAAAIDGLTLYNQVLQDATQKGSSGNHYNLSNATGAAPVENTANCYLISAPGYYRIPLVYGNAVKNGAVNENAYKTDNIDTRILKNFKDHNGVDIDDPWITQSNDGANAPDSARIVWTDQSGIVSDLGLEGSGTDAFVRFHVPADKIKNGNAVIAVTSRDTVVWSWHLWFAHSDVLNTIACTNKQNVVYHFTRLPLGFVWRQWEGSSYDKPRVARLKVEQTVANGGVKLDKYIDITQNPGSGVKEQSSTYYQFGRKDAMPGVQTVSDGSYNINDNNNMSIQNGIQHPETFYADGNTWSYGYSYYNLWSMDNTTTGFNDNPVVKTIYDPCPAGFKMPASNAFTGFTTTGNNTSDQTEFNVSGDWDKGWHFNNRINSPDTTVFFPASGCRYYNGSLYNVGERGYYWSAVLRFSFPACNLYFAKQFVEPWDYSRRSYGFSVRPVSE